MVSAGAPLAIVALGISLALPRLSAADGPYWVDRGGADIQLAQFALPKLKEKGPGGGAFRPPALPRALRFEYVFASELEVPYTRDLDLDRGLSDDSLTATPTLLGLITYRPAGWLQLTGEMKAERPVSLREEDVVLLPDGELQSREDKRLELRVSQAFAKLKLDFLPFELTLGRRNFEDPKLWIYDAALDAAIFSFRPGDFRIEASVSRQDAVDLDLAGHVPKQHTNNYMVHSEYRGIEDHQFAAYFVLRDHPPSEGEGRPRFYGVNATARPSDRLHWWGHLAYVDGRDEDGLSLVGYAVDAGATYRFPSVWLQPSVTLHFGYGSGDGDTTDGKNHQFRQTGLQTNEAKFGGVTQFKVYGEVLDPELSNLQIYTAAAGVRPAANMFIDLVYHHYRLNAIAETIRGSSLTAKMNQVATVPSKDVGGEIDIVVGFRNLFGVRGLGADLRGGWFFPGDAFLQDAGGGAARDADRGFRFIAKIFF